MGFVKDRIAPYKYPRWIEFVAELPKTATGKIQRFKLRASALMGTLRPDRGSLRLTAPRPVARLVPRPARLTLSYAGERVGRMWPRRRLLSQRAAPSSGYSFPRHDRHGSAHLPPGRPRPAHRAGDREAFAMFYDRRRWPRARAGSPRILRDDAAAEEVLQEVFWQVWQDAGQYDPGRGSPEAWLVMRARTRDHRQAAVHA